MAGDVFGNGMLLSEHTRLVCAFNHMHIFFDPAPNRSNVLRGAKAVIRKPIANLGRLRQNATVERRRYFSALSQVD